MKKTIKLAMVVALALGTTSVFATNGSNLIATGAKARGMGGVSIGVAHGAESGLNNVALMTSLEKTMISFGGTFFNANVDNTNGINLDFTRMDGPNLGDETTSSSSKADLSVIPEVSLANKIDDNFYIGVGMWGTAGMGVDYRDAKNSGQMQMVTNVQSMQFGIPLAYKVDSFSIGITPLLQYGSLDINYVMSPAMQNAFAMMHGVEGSATTPSTVGAGIAQDLKLGYNLGIAYEVNGITLGAIYKSKIDMEYTGSLSSAIQGFGVGAYTNDILSTPAELGVGVSYKMAEHIIAFDYKKIQWSDASGYKDFGWEDQDVFALGYQYTTKGWAVRVGFNHAKSPISEQARTTDERGTETNINSAGLSAGVVNTFNLLGFPGIIESNYTIGGTYNFSKQFSADLAYVFAPEASQTYKNFLGQDITTTHSQNSLSIQINYIF